MRYVSPRPPLVPETPHIVNLANGGYSYNRPSRSYSLCARLSGRLWIGGSRSGRPLHPHDSAQLAVERLGLQAPVGQSRTDQHDIALLDRFGHQHAQ